jgi:hypothetical protein
MAHKTARLTVDLMSPVLENQREQQSAPETSLIADLTPELLEQEAERLGLDPKDKQQVLQQLSASLKKPGS